MAKLSRYLQAFCDSTVKILVTGGVFFMSIMTIIIWVQVIMRYIFKIGLPWAEEISKYLMVWSAMLGAAVVYVRNEHIAVDFIYQKMPEKYRNWIKVGHILLAMGFFFVLTYQGWFQALFGLRFKSPAVGITRFWPYLSIFAGGLFMLIFSISLFLLHVQENFLKVKKD